MAGIVEILVDILRSTTPLKGASQCLEKAACLTCDTDIMESAVCALANVLSLYALNANRLVAAGGLEVLFKLVHSNLSVDLLDSDRLTQIQASAANAIANAVALLGETARKKLVAAFYHVSGDIRYNDNDNCVSPLLPPSQSPKSLNALVLLCVANLSTARRAAALLLGNLALDPELRSELGRVGAIEALWSVSNEAHNTTQRTTALWALSNLVWSNSANQERCGPFLDSALALASVNSTSVDLCNKIGHAKSDQKLSPHTRSVALQISDSRGSRQSHILGRACAVCLVANSLYFNDSNRIRVESSLKGVETLVALSGPNESPAVREPALRCLASLTATDRGAKRVALAKAHNGVDACTTLVTAAGDNNFGGEDGNVRRLGAAALANICSLADARSRVCVSSVKGLILLSLNWIVFVDVRLVELLLWLHWLARLMQKCDTKH